MSPFTIVAVVLFLGALIFVHEMGHFLAAKYFDIKVTKFSLGFGPPLVAFTRGETTYQVAIVPLGGYVRMAGEYPGEELAPEDKARAFTSAPVHQRAIVALAGPAANLAFPVLCFFAYNVLGPEVAPAVVGEVEPGKPGDRAGLEPGDRILEVDGERIWSFRRLTDVVGERPERTVSIRVARGERELAFEVTPEAVAGRDPFGRPKARGMISVSAERDGTTLGVEDPSRLPPGLEGFRTGEAITAIDGQPVQMAEGLVPAFAAAAGRSVPVEIERPVRLEAGDILRATRYERRTVQVRVPGSIEGLSDLGLGVGAAFVREVVPGGAAERAGIQPGDRILSADGEPVHHFWRFATYLQTAEGKPVKVRLRRSGEDLETTLVPLPVSCEHPVRRVLTERLDAGFGRGSFPESGVGCETLLRPHTSWAASVATPREQVRLGLDEALMEGLRLTGQVISLLTTHLFKMLVTQEVSTKTVGGPLQFMNVAAQAAEAGLFAYLEMLAFISINLGVFNLLPVPVLDGGHLVFCLVEAVKRKPLSPAAREKAALVGLAMLALLLLLALRNDIRALDIF